MKLSRPVIGLIVLLIAPPSGWTGWMAADDADPYVRLSGEIVPWLSCRDEKTGAVVPGTGRVAPGDCVAVVWQVYVNHKRMAECDVAKTEHVSRTITDAVGVRPMARSVNTYGGNTGRKIENPLVRPFILPDWSVKGPAAYWSEALFTCNPLQRAFPETFAQRINTPIVPYYVESPPAGR